MTIRARRQRIEGHQAHVEATGVPVGPPRDSSKRYIADIIVRRPAPPLPTARDAGHAAPTALTGGFQAAFLLLGAIGLIAVPAIFALVRRDELSDAVARTTVREPQPALAPMS